MSSNVVDIITLKYISTPCHIWLSFSTYSTISSHSYLYFCHSIAPHLCLSLFTLLLCITSSHVLQLVTCAHVNPHTVNLKGKERGLWLWGYTFFQHYSKQYVWIHDDGDCFSVRWCMLIVCVCVWVCNYKTSVQCEEICHLTTGCDSQL